MYRLEDPLAAKVRTLQRSGVLVRRARHVAPAAPPSPWSADAPALPQERGVADMKFDGAFFIALIGGVTLCLSREFDDQIIRVLVGAVGWGAIFQALHAAREGI
jgi:hypothetical protein